MKPIPKKKKTSLKILIGIFIKEVCLKTADFMPTGEGARLNILRSFQFFLS